MACDDRCDLGSMGLHEIMIATWHDLEQGIGQERTEAFARRDRGDGVLVAPKEQGRGLDLPQLGRQVFPHLGNPGSGIGKLGSIGAPPVCAAEILDRNAARCCG